KRAAVGIEEIRDREVANSVAIDVAESRERVSEPNVAVGGDLVGEDLPHPPGNTIARDRNDPNRWPNRAQEVADRVLTDSELECSVAVEIAEARERRAQ